MLVMSFKASNHAWRGLQLPALKDAGHAYDVISLWTRTTMC